MPLSADLIQSKSLDSFDRSCLQETLPQIHLLANQQMTSMFTAAGAGYVHYEGDAVTRWKPDRTRDAEGYFIYLRDLESGEYWSTGFQPTCAEPEKYTANFQPGRAEIERVDNDILSRMEVCLASEANVELRRCTLTNRGLKQRKIEITSYAELVLQDAVADSAHPAFSKLFVQTKFSKEHRALVAHRRKRSSDDKLMAACHFLVGDLGQGVNQFETDRCRFIGRGNSLSNPIALQSTESLAATSGSVLDPIFSLRRTFVLDPGESACVTYLLAAGDSEEDVLATCEQFSSQQDVERAFLAAAELTSMPKEFTEPQLRFALQLASNLLYGRTATGKNSLWLKETWLESVGDMPGLFSTAVPFLACVLTGPDDLMALETLLQSQSFLKGHGLTCNLILVNRSSIEQSAIARIINEYQELASKSKAEEPFGHVEVIEHATLTKAQRDQLCRFSRMCTDDELPACTEVVRLKKQAVELSVSTEVAGNVRAREGFSSASASKQAEEFPSEESLQFDNGIGGFSQEGTEYVMRVRPIDSNKASLPPLPWVNVIANEKGGTIISETGAGYSWAENSRNNRLTTWSNDPVCDPHSEALFICDDESNSYWSLTPGPAPANASYEVRHGFGYTHFSHTSNNLEQKVLKFLPRDDSVIITQVKIRNNSERKRHLILYVYNAWELSDGNRGSDRRVETSIDEPRRTIFATNFAHEEFASNVSFAALGQIKKGQVETSATVSYTADRSEFLGRNRGLRNPQSVSSAAPLSGRSGLGLDPCAASRISLDLAPGECLEFVALLGNANSKEEAISLIARYQDLDAVEQAYQETRSFWRETLTTVQIKTPAPAIDLMVNGWLAYQNLSCRVWGRSAFYQSGGAYGFRDQLQDSAALLTLNSDLTRQQILRNAAHQFVEGDVLHWWHPPASRGLRTTFADDLLWLPLVASEYVLATGDHALWQEQVRFITAPLLASGEPEAFLQPEDSGECGSVYEHCCRALDRGLTCGDHGLPLIGSGDWNDGMNRIGQGGKGESVWLGFFIDYILERMLPCCEKFEDHKRLEHYRGYRKRLRLALNDAGWDGEWYRRAFFDDGTPIGTKNSKECQIDALVQAWAVLSGVAPVERAQSCIAAVEKHLVDNQAKLIRLLDPPFDRMKKDPGYIKGYLPGIRENGGQYTHGVLWFIQAVAQMGKGTRAVELIEMLLPVNHGSTPTAVATYKAEPYVVAADVYGQAPHVGRAGWSWYTGSAGWMYRVILESLLGFRLEGGDTLRINPQISANWPSFQIDYRLPDKKTRLEIVVENPNGKQAGVLAAALDGQPLVLDEQGVVIPLPSDGKLHFVKVLL